MTFPRRTVRETVTIEGRGLHTGVPVCLRVHPGEAGVALRYGSTRTLAHPSNVTDTTRSTRIGEIGTVEHVMSTFAGLEITDVEVELDAPEMPALDGSSAPLVGALLATGLVEVGALQLPPLFTRVFLQEDNGTKLAIAKGTGQWRYVFTSPGRWPEEQVFELEDVVEGYPSEVAPSRTFAFAEEVPLLIQAGMAKGLDETSALILGIEGYKNLPRFPDEPARHKLLDLIGDLYLAGVPIRALSVVAERSGHRANVKAAAMLAEAMARAA